MFLLKRGVKDTLSDERIEQIACKAARVTYSVSALLMALVGMVLIAARNEYPAYADIGYAFSYAVCGMMLVYLGVYAYYNKKGDRV